LQQTSELVQRSSVSQCGRMLVSVLVTVWVAVWMAVLVTDVVWMTKAAISRSVNDSRLQAQYTNAWAQATHRSGACGCVASQRID
jgi:hypothetical protein